MRFKSIFKQYYDVFFALKNKDAFYKLSNNDIDVVISDQVLGGSKLQELVRNQCPHAAFILLVDDLNAANNNHELNAVYQHISKPWDVEELKLVVQEGAKLSWSRKIVSSLGDQHKRSDHHSAPAPPVPTPRCSNTYNVHESGISRSTATSSNIAILLVEQDQAIRNAIQMLGPRLNFHIYVASTLTQVIRMIAMRTEISIVIMNLTTFSEEEISKTLSTFYEMRSDVVTMAVINQGDSLDNVVDLMNNGKLFRCLQKPFDNKKLYDRIIECFKQHDKLKETKVSLENYPPKESKKREIKKLLTLFKSSA